MKKEVNIGAKKEQTEEINVPFVPVDLSFDKLTYEVTASTSKEQLRLLNEVSGVFKAGRMCALMGSSGAGKTTLMDVIGEMHFCDEIRLFVRLFGISTHSSIICSQQ